ncbi:hypothetical protein LTR08_002201 [Meristemomyces frigidus]|nr:hypothetical protein LTR08_002201 [Meristemomyces frigidus]
MPSILSDDDKQTVKRCVPKASNKIHAVAVAKLYIAYPDRAQWTATQLQGAVVLANDLVGNTFWLKLVDISPANRGVVWDQEIYDSFQYNQDRTFFHTFEGEAVLFGLSFADEKEARQFRKKVDEREKNAHKATRAKAFASGPAQTGGYGQGPQAQVAGGGGKSHGRLGGLFSRHHSVSAQQAPAQSIIPPRGVEINHAPSHSGGSGGTPPMTPAQRQASASGIDLADPAVQAVLADLLQMGITEDQIEEHAGFIKSYLEQSKATAAADTARAERAARAPPPPPPPPPPTATDLSPQNTGSSGNSKRGPPPAPPPSRRTAAGPPIHRAPSPSPSPSPPPREPSPPRPRFRVPPPLADAGKLVQQQQQHSPAQITMAPARNRASSAAGPPPPPRPPKTPIMDDEGAQTASQHSPQPPARFGVPPPFDGHRISSTGGSGSGGGPPLPPARGLGLAGGHGSANGSAGPGMPPPPPPPREAAHAMMPPPPPPRNGIAPASPLAATFAAADAHTAPPPPPPMPPMPPMMGISARPVPGAPGSVAPAPPLPPPAPAPAAFSGGGAPPPPPLPPPNAAGPPPPPPMPPRDPTAPSAPSAPSAPPAPLAVGGLLADIQMGTRLKKVSEGEKRDRSMVVVPGGEGGGGGGGGAGSAGGGGSGGGGGGDTGLAGALASALAARKSKVSHSDDEKDDDDW